MLLAYTVKDYFHRNFWSHILWNFILMRLVTKPVKFVNCGQWLHKINKNETILFWHVFYLIWKNKYILSF